MKKAFSVLELVISLMVIASIMAAFTPLITKKFSSSIFGKGGKVNLTTDCTDKFGEFCTLCDDKRCIRCTLDPNTCAGDQYKDTASCTCKDCKETYGEDCEKCNEKKCLTCPSGQYLDSDDNCQSCSDKFSNCATCTESECTSCADGYVLTNPTSSTPCSNFNCSGPDFIQIGKLCITKKNMGNGTSLTIPNGVNVVNVGTTCMSSETNFCCWKGNTSGTTCDNANGGAYSGCDRTVCDWYAADYICKNFTAGGRTWRLATKDEMSNWGTNSIGLGVNGLQLCDLWSGYSSAYCGSSHSCPGSNYDWCYPYYVWSGTVNGSSLAYGYRLNNGSWGQGNGYRTDAISVRCVAEMSQSCADKIGAGCKMCDGNTCLKCASGYILKNGKCEKFSCSGEDFIQIGNLCITKKNMGDGTSLTIPNALNVVNSRTSCSPSASNFCCWRGTTASPCDNENGGAYDGCRRTVCDWWAADYICKNFTAGGRTWRLATKDEMSNWGDYSIGKGANGLQLCDTSSNYSSAQCGNSNNYCPGSLNNQCISNFLWSSLQTSQCYSYGGGIYAGKLIQTSSICNYGSSVRCVAEMSQSCADKISAGCEMCDGNTCLKCASGYVLKNGKCEIDCSKFGSACTSCTTSACTACSSGYNLIHGVCGNSYCMESFGSDCINCGRIGTSDFGCTECVPGSYVSCHSCVPACLKYSNN